MKNTTIKLFATIVFALMLANYSSAQSLTTLLPNSMGSTTKIIIAESTSYLVNDQNYNDNIATIRKEKITAKQAIINTLETNPQLEIKKTSCETMKAIGDEISARAKIIDFTEVHTMADIMSNKRRARMVAELEAADAVIILTHFEYHFRKNKKKNKDGKEAYQKTVKSIWELYDANGKLLDRFKDKSEITVTLVQQNKQNNLEQFEWDGIEQSIGKIIGEKYGQRFIQEQGLAEVTPDK